MAWTKRQLIEAAFGELALAARTFDIAPEELIDALRRMDSMVATWDAQGVSIGYALPASPSDSDPDDDAGIPDTAAEAVYLGLALRLAPGYGKSPSADTRVAARAAFAPLLAEAVRPVSQRLPAGIPLGAGHKGAGLPRFTPDPGPAVFDLGTGGQLNLLPE